MSLTARDVRFGAGRTLILDGVSVVAAPGRMLGVLGPNGSGKSTLLRLLCRLRRVASGVVTLDGGDINGIDRAALARRIAFVEQQATTEAAVSVLDVVRLGRTPFLGPLRPWTAVDTAAVEAALARVDMADRRAQPWHTLSGGERQRVHIARALAQTPTELILDEPTNHLDVRHQLDILALVGRLNVTSVVALHDLNLAALYCDEVVVLRAGRVAAAGAPEAVLTAALIADVFGVAAVVAPSPHHGRPHIHFLPPGSTQMVPR